MSDLMNTSLPSVAQMLETVEKAMGAEEDEFVYFHMKVDDKEFRLGLFDVLQALHFAEEQGEIPKIDRDWWWKVCSRYDRLETPDLTVYEGKCE